MDNNNALANLSKAARMLAESKTLEEVKHIMNIAEAARTYARAAKLGLQAYNDAAEVKVRAERKAGEMLAQLERTAPQDARSHSKLEYDSPYREVLDENEIPTTTAFRWQQMAKMPEQVFEERIDDLRGERPITSSGVIQEARKAEVETNLRSVENLEAKKIEGTYDVIVIDPPWPIKKIKREVAPNQVEFEYPTMDLEEIMAMKIPCADDCHVWLWTTQKYLPYAFFVLQAWELKYICTFGWHKAGGFQPFNLPQYNEEFALYARKGSPSFVDLSDFKTCFNAPRGAHSEKPEVFYEMVRRVTAGRRLDMFNRRPIEGFEGWGKESV